MKKLYFQSRLLMFLLLTGMLLISSIVKAQTTLAAGDIAFTGYNQTESTVNGGANNRDFSFILLKNISAGTVISFTDYGWRSDAQAFQTALPCGVSTGAVTDGIIQWTASTGLPYGTQVVIRCRYAPSASVGSISSTQATYNSAHSTVNPTPPLEYVTIAAGGDEVFAYQGTFAAPTLISALRVVSTTWNASLANCDFNSSNSVLPATLNSAGLNFAPNSASGNTRLKGTVSIPTDPASARAVIYNVSNWEFNATTALTLPAAPATTAPVLTTTTPATSITSGEAALAGNISATGGATITERGFVYSTSANPIISGSGVTKVIVGGTTTGTFSKVITSLNASTTYHFQAYATNSTGTSYGGDQSFTTQMAVSTCPQVTTADFSSADDVPPFHKTISGQSFTFAGTAHNFMSIATDLGGFSGLYPYNYVDDETQFTITAPSGYSFDFNSFQYVTNRGTVPLTITLTFTNNTTDTKTYNLTSNSIIKTFTGFTTAANDIKSITFHSTALLYYNGFCIDDVKLIPAAATTLSSLNSANTLTTNAATVNYTATFAAAVTGLTASNFTLSGAGATGASVGTPTTSNNITWNIPVNTGANGALLLTFANATGLTPGISTTLPFAGNNSYIIDKTPPTLTITRSDPSPIHDNVLDFQAIFSKPVTGVDLSDFTLTNTGGITNGAISVSMINATTYNITVNVTGTGTSRLDLKGAGTGITDAAGNVPAAFIGGDIYNVDQTPPVVNSITRAGTNPTGASSVNFTVTFSEPVTGVAPADFTANGTGVSTTGIAVTGSGATYTVTVNGVSGSGTLGLNLNSSGTGIFDAAANPIAAGFTTGETYNILSNNANLAGLATSASGFAPTFDPAVITYTASVPNTTTTATVTPTVAITGSTVQVRVNGGTYVTVISGSPSANLALNVGDNPVDVKVTAQDGTTIKIYTLTVTRATAADLAVTVSNSPEPVQYNGTLTTTITVTNNGPGAAQGTNVQMTISPLINRSTFVAGSGAPGWSTTYNVSTGLLKFTDTNAGGLASGSTATFTFTFVPAAGTSGTVPFTATVASTTADSNPTNNTSTFNTTVIGQVILPVVATNAGSAAFVAADNATSTPVAIDPGLTVTSNTGTLASATLAITGNLHSGEDVLAFTNNGASMGNIAGTYDISTGVYMLFSTGGTATAAQWQSALRSVTYTNTAVTPNTATRTVSFNVNDGTNNSNTSTRTVTVTGTDQTPILTTSGGTTAYTHPTAVVIDNGLTVSDLDNATLSTGKVSLTSGFQTNDLLTFVNTSKITGSYNSATGALTLTSAGATASVAEWQAAMRSVTFSSSATAPNTGNRTAAFIVNDGTKTSAAAIKTISVALPGINVGPSTLPGATVGIAYNQTITATGGTSYTYAVSTGALPTGLTLNGTNGAITGTPTAAGTFNFTVTATDASTAFASQAYTVVVTPPTTLITPATLPGGGVGIAYNQNIVASGGIAPYTYSVTAGAVPNGLTLSTSGALTGTPTTGGIFNFTATATGSSTGSGAPHTGSRAYSLVIGTATQTITFADVSATYGDAPVTLTGTASSGLAVTYASSDPTVATVSGNTVTILKAGSTIITASQTGNGNYSAAADVPKTLTVNAKAITVTATAQSKTYGDVDPALVYTITTGALVTGDAFTGSLTRDAGENAGTYVIKKGSLALSNNYTLTYTGANLTIGARAITVTANVQSKTYGAVDPVLTYQITSGSLAFADTFTGALTRDAGENAGTYAIKQGTLALSSNYALTYASANLSITPRTLTVTATGNNKTYDGNTTATVALSDNRVAGDLFTESYAGASFNTPGVGTSKPVNVTGIAISGGASANYTLGNVTASTTADITAIAIAVTANAQTKTYGAADPALTYTYTGTLAGSDAFTGALSRAPGEAVNTYAINQNTLVLSSNYSLTYNGANLAIIPAALTITATGPAKPFGTALTTGASTTNFTATATQNGETVNSVILTPNAAGLSATTPSGANYTVIPSAATGTNGFTTSNYNITYVPFTGTVGTTGQTIAFGPLTSAIYGQSPVTLTATASSGLAVIYTSSNPSVATVSGNTLTIVGAGSTTITAKQAGNGNYTAAADVPQSLTVNAKAITVTADAKTKTYGDTDPALTYKITTGTLVGTDAFAGALTRDAGENAGSYAITQGTLALSSNYTLTYTSGNLIINTKAITVTADAKSKTYGDTDPALTYKITSGTLVNTDAFTGSLTRDAGENAGTYAINQGTLAVSSNYALTYTSANLTIGAKAIAVTADAKSKTYGDTDPALTYKITSGTLVNTDAFTGSLTRDAGTAVGTYAIKQGTLALNSNYTLTYTGANLAIAAKAITVTADAKTKTFGEADPALTYKITSGTLVNTDAFTGSLTRDAGEAVGTYAIKQGALALSSNYTLSYTSANLTISQKKLTITAVNQSKAYGSANPGLTVTYSGFVGTDNAGSLTTLPTISTTATASSGAGTYPINASGAVMPNYIIEYVAGTLTINKATLTVTADNKSRNYGVANPALTVTYNGFVNGDDATKLTTAPTPSTTATATSAPGNYTIAVNGGVSANYNFNYVNEQLTVIPLTNANASGLAVSAGTLSPAFATGTLTYKVTVENSVDNIRLTPTFDPTATARINGTATTNGSPSFSLPLNVGDNQITLVVTAQDGTTKITYTVNVYRGVAPLSISATNILTPNGDGKNDYWVIQDIQLYPNNNVVVYDKAGRSIYSKHGYNNDWNGTLQGAPLNEGTYYYTVDLGPGLPKFRGYITILKSH
jgi:gliding motility-associated-like protein